MAVDESRLPNPSDILFWREIRNAYDQVATNSERQIVIERQGRKATIAAASTFIMIAIEEVNTEIKEPLIVPS